MKTKKLCMMALAAMLVGTSCSRVDLDELGPGTGGGGSNSAVRFFDGQVNDLSLRLANYQKTSGPNRGTDSAVFERGDLIGIYMVDTLANPGFLNVLRANVAYKKVFGDTFLLASGTDSIRLPTAGVVKFFAYYPWDANTGWPFIFWSVKDQSDPSKLDLLTASDNNSGNGYGKMYLGNNNLNTPPTPPLSYGNVPLKFRHMLSKITINLQAGTGSDIDQNSVLKVTMGVIGGSGYPPGRILEGDTVILGGTFDMSHDRDSAYSGPQGGYLSLQPTAAKGVITFFPATSRSRYTALVIPARYGKKSIGVSVADRNGTPQDFVANLPQSADTLRYGNMHYIVTATLQLGAVSFDNVTIGDWTVVKEDEEIFAR